MPGFQVTGTAQKQAWADRVMPPVERLAPDLWSVPVPMPDNPLRYVLIYLLGTPDGVVLIDAGWNTEEAWSALTGGLATAGFHLDDVRGVLVTHVHPDHYGLAGRVQEASGAWVALHAEDEKLLRDRYDEPGIAGLVELTRVHLMRCGVPLDAVDELSTASMGIRDLIRRAQVDVLFADGDRIGLPNWNLQAVWTPGHSPGHLCFFDQDRRILFSGDHVLPRITSAVTVHPQQRPSPLADFMAALGKVAAPRRRRGVARPRVPISRSVGPGRRHCCSTTSAGWPRCWPPSRRQPGSTAWDVAQRLTWARPWDTIPPFLRRSAAGETLAHLLVGQARGLVQPSDEPPATQFWTT